MVPPRLRGLGMVFGAIMTARLLQMFATSMIDPEGFARDQERIRVARERYEAEQAAKARAAEQAEAASQSPPPSSSGGGVSDAVKTRCALQVDENAYGFFDGNSVDTRAWRQTTNDRINFAYIRCLRENGGR